MLHVLVEYIFFKLSLYIYVLTSALGLQYVSVNLLLSNLHCLHEIGAKCSDGMKIICTEQDYQFDLENSKFNLKFHAEEYNISILLHETYEICVSESVTSYQYLIPQCHDDHILNRFRTSGNSVP